MHHSNSLKELYPGQINQVEYINLKIDHLKIISDQKTKLKNEHIYFMNSITKH